MDFAFSLHKKSMNRAEYIEAIIYEQAVGPGLNSILNFQRFKELLSFQIVI